MRIKIIIVLLFVSLGSSRLFGQRNGEYKPIVSHVEKHQLTANLMAPGAYYEVGVIGNSTLSTGFSPGLSTFNSGTGLGYALQSRLRIYTNMKKRLAKKKNISGNSGDYVALANSVFFGDLQITGNLETPEDFTMTFNGALYGVQRTYERGFNYNVELGIGNYAGNNVDNGVGVLINLSFGWVLTNRR